MQARRRRRRGGVRRASVGAVAALAFLATLPTAETSAQPGPHGPATNGPRPVSGASPYAPGCGLDQAATGYGDGTAHTETEPTLSVDPTDPRRLVTAWMQDLYQGYVVASSRNGGSTWRTVTVPGVSPCTGDDYELAADPWLSTGPDGTVWLAGISLDLRESSPRLPYRTRLQVSTSPDGGLSWSAPSVVVAGTGRLHDKPSLVADPRRPGHAHVVWTEFLTALGPPADGIHLASTTDGGRTWSEPRRLPFPVPSGAVPQGAIVTVLPDGALSVVTTLRAPNTSDEPHLLLATRSTDGGQTWSAATTVASFPATRGRHSTPWDAPDFGDPIDAPEWAISAAAGPHGDLYVTWVHAHAPLAADVRLARSPDGGVTWQAPRTVAGSGRRAYLPVVAVHPEGTIGLTWYDDRRDVSGDTVYSSDLWFAESPDQGARWTERHLAGSFDVLSAPMRRIPVRGRFLGDYTGLVPLPGGFGSVAALGEPYAQVGGTDVMWTRIHTRRPTAAGPATPR